MGFPQKIMIVFRGLGRLAGVQDSQVSGGERRESWLLYEEGDLNQ